ncbi:hypothetical protein D3C87_1797720 [compost metagenome]
MFGVLFHRFVRLGNVKVFKAFAVAVEEGYRGMKAIHARMIAEEYGESGQPAALLIHIHKRLQHILFLRRVQDHAQRMVRKVSVPGPVVYIKWPAAGVDLFVITAVILVVFGNIHHPLICAVER